MVVLDVLLVIVFAALAVYYGLRAQKQRAEGNPQARWSLVATVFLALAAIAWIVSLVIQVS